MQEEAATAMDAEERRHLTDYYADLPDEALDEAYWAGPEGFRDLEVWHIIETEHERRGPTQPADSLDDPADSQPSDERPTIEGIFAHAADKMGQGVPFTQIEAGFVDEGFDAETAASIVSALAEARRESARKNMIHGALWSIGGLAVTVTTYVAAAPGETYVLAWGAIIFGAVQFFKGVSDANSPAHGSTESARSVTASPPEQLDTKAPHGSESTLPHVRVDGPAPADEPKAAQALAKSPRHAPMIVKLLVGILVVYLVLRIIWLFAHEGL